MKTVLRFALIAAMTVSAAACSDMKESPEQVTEQKLVFTATREGVNPDTRSIRMDDGSVWWQPTEKIAFNYRYLNSGYWINGRGYSISGNSEPAQTIQFPLGFNSGSSPTEWVVYAFYPYSLYRDFDWSNSLMYFDSPSGQVGAEGNFSGNSFPALAMTNTLDLAFQNICGGIKFSVSRDDIISVTFKGNDSEVLAGTVGVGFDSEDNPVVVDVNKGISEVTLGAPDGNPFKPGVFYYMTLLPASLEKGFTMSFHTATETGILVSTKPQTVKRSVFGVLKNVDAGVTDWTVDQIPDPEAVDLGLSVKWATFNVGARKPEGYGDFFAWGETEPYYMPGCARFENPAWRAGKETGYNAYSYKWADVPTETITKYNCQEKFGPLDYKFILEPGDDAATANWGGDWRTPTITEIRELIDNCNWECTELNGIAGFKVSGKKQGYQDNSIFIPAAGFREDDGYRYSGMASVLWSSSLYPNSEESYCLQGLWNKGSEAVIETDCIYRTYGFTVRPVQSQLIKVQSMSISSSNIELKLGESAQLTATFTPGNATEKLVYWISSDYSVAEVDVDTGIVTALKEGTATVTAVSDGMTASCEVTVDGFVIPDAVDLGLSVKWASFNLFAARPEGRGSYFKWGETKPGDGLGWETYKWCNGDNSSLTKYNYDAGYGPVIDYIRTLTPEDDAATVNLGGAWRIPTRSEILELLEDCTWEEKKINGISGYRVSGKRDGFQDNWIFIPMDQYWSSTLDHFTPYSALCTSFSYYLIPDYRVNDSDRSNALLIRPVYEEFIPVSSITLDKNTLELKVGDSARLTATISPSNASAPSVSWGSGDEKIVSVDQSGNITANAVGSTTVTAYTSNGLSASCTITVSEPYPGYEICTDSRLEYYGTYLYNFMPPRTEDYGGLCYLYLIDKDNNQLTFWMYTDLFRSEEEVELTTGTYTKNSDDYVNNTLAARRLTYMPGINIGTEEYPYTAGSWYYSFATGKSYPVADGTLEVSKKGSQYTIKADMKDRNGNEYKLVYVGAVPVDASAASYPE